MKIPMSIRELEEILSRRWFAPERRLYIRLVRSRSQFNRRRYLLALIRKLERKGVILTPSLVEEILSLRETELQP